MDKLIKLNNQTGGRDKIARLLQYLSRFLWHRLEQNHKNGIIDFRNLEAQLSTFRKLLRFGRFFESLYTTLPLFEYEDVAIRVTVILSKIANAFFLLTDHILWMGRADVCSVDTVKWGQISNKYWLYSITMNLVRDFYEISRLIDMQKPELHVTNLRSGVTFLSTFVHNNQDVVIDTVKNVCDFFIPLNALGHTKLSASTIGVLGTVSSIAGLLVLLEPSKKLSPS